MREMKGLKQKIYFFFFFFFFKVCYSLLYFDTPSVLFLKLFLLHYDF